MFTFEPSSEWAYGGGIGSIEISPERLVRLFGDPVPNPGEPEKITGEYVFIAPSGRRYNVHDYNITSSDPTYGPTPYQLWSSSEPIELSIGGDKPADEEELQQFKDWLLGL